MTEPGKFHDALKAGGFEYSAFSCNGVDLFGDSASIAALKCWHHDAGTVPQLKAEIITARERSRALDTLEKIYVEKVADLEAEKARGNLTQDYGEQSLRCARLTLEDIRRAARSLPSTMGEKS